MLLFKTATAVVASLLVFTLRTTWLELSIDPT